MGYCKRFFSAKDIAANLANGVDVLIWERGWEVVASADSFVCAFGYNNERHYPLAKLRWIDYSGMSKKARYEEVKALLEEIFSK